MRPDRIRASGLLAFAVFALAGCARPPLPLINIWREPGVYPLLGLTIETTRDRVILRDPGCAVFTLKLRREMATPSYGYEYVVLGVTDVTPECEIAREARIIQIGSGVDGEAERAAHPMGSGIGYLLMAGTCMPGDGCETLLGRYFGVDSPPITENYREIALRNGG
ncbi:MAG: hypothetical protein EON87_16560 [Brevundimonas sp.]|nr:MAG: hypothetical protein EON87_16560 [Brevundimonas sp.]